MSIGSSVNTDLLDQLIAISSAMLESAHAQNWEPMIERQSERDALARAAFPEPLVAASPEVLEKVRAVLDLDRQLVEIGRRHRDELALKRLELRRARKSARFYEA